ncbi:MAG: T9SS type A sorting domain-containing protein [Chitinophagaceae bacterium]|nr:T9SS type A sorting domain-containing protein [Chitinophagaceae bacterium]
MKSAIFLQIATPCNENWEKMTPMEKGKFCASCAMQVTDFTLMTDKEILQYLSTTRGKVCGRIHADQSNRALINYENKKSKKIQWTIAGLMSLLFSINKVNAQQKTVKESPKSSWLAANRNEDMVTIKQSVTVLKDNAKNLNTPYLHQVFAIENSLVSKSASAFLINNNDTTIIKEVKDTSLSFFDKASFEQTNIMIGGITTFSDEVKPAPFTTFVKKVFNKSFFKISPNPTNNNGVTISIKQPGNYVVQIFNNNSILVYTTEIEVSYKDEKVQIKFNGSIAKGTYYIRVIDKKNNNQYTDKLLVN